MDNITPTHKIIADHIRSITFLINDGVIPSNEGAGYVLRRIIRRAMRYLNQNNIRKPFLFKISKNFINRNISYYPSLEKSKDFIISTLITEEEKFQITLDKGMKILKGYLKNNKKSKIFPGEEAFKLYDTYGFPFDLTEDILKEYDIEIDIKEFENHMLKQKNLARNSNKNGFIFAEEVYAKIKQNHCQTSFSGYKNLNDKSKIIAIIKNGKNLKEISEENIAKDDIVDFILDKTPFYATSGGQNGDEGELKNKENKTLISQTIKKEELFLHRVKQLSGNFAIGNHIDSSINRLDRSAKSKNHSATHLLHHCLKKTLGKQLQQKGSNICSSYFSFDFNHNKSLSYEEITKIENMVNNYISQNSEVKTEIMPFETAIKNNAIALFGEKYEKEVRVLSMGLNENNQYDCVELCGGTHVKNLGEIGLFIITSEKSIASGIRRIEAKTSQSAFEFLKKNENEFKKEINNQNQQIKQQEKLITKLKQQILLQSIDKFNQQKFTKYQLITHIFLDTDFNEIRQFIMNIKNHKNFKEKTIMIFFVEKNNKANIITISSKDISDQFQANQIIKNINIKLGNSSGGGSKEIAFSGGINFEELKKINIQSAINQLH